MRKKSFAVLTSALVVLAFFAGVALSPVIVGNIEIGYRITPLQVQVLTDRDYYHSLIEDLEKANETILVAMYSMIYDPDDTEDWANDVIRELAEAKERGVNVTVIIEHQTHWDCQDENLEAYQYLTSHGVTVYLDEDTETDHMKLVIIDGYIVYVGSHNWSESGLYYNRETSVRIVNEEVAEEFENYFWTIIRS